MKRIVFISAMLMMALFSLTSCGGDDEPKEKTTATATYSLAISQDLLDACNVFITYKAENGRNVMESVTSTWWTKTVTSDRFPAEFGVMYKFSTKSDAELVKEKYDLSCELTFALVTSKSASYSNKVTIINSKGVARDKVVDVLNKLSGTSTGFKVTVNGIVSEANNLRYE